MRMARAIRPVRETPMGGSGSVPAINRGLAMYVPMGKRQTAVMLKNMSVKNSSFSYHLLALSNMKGHKYLKVHISAPQLHSQSARMVSTANNAMRTKWSMEKQNEKARWEKDTGKKIRSMYVSLNVRVIRHTDAHHAKRETIAARPAKKHASSKANRCWFTMGRGRRHNPQRARRSYIPTIIPHTNLKNAKEIAMMTVTAKKGCCVLSGKASHRCLVVLEKEPRMVITASSQVTPSSHCSNTLPTTWGVMALWKNVKEIATQMMIAKKGLSVMNAAKGSSFLGVLGVV